MKIRKLFLTLCVLVLLSLSVSACGAEPTPAPIAEVPGVSVLWADVPAFPGAVPNLELNAFFNSSGPVGSTMNYFTDKQPSEVADFYTYKMMHALGWEVPEVKQVTFFSQGGHGGGPEDKVGTIVGCWTDIYRDKPRSGCWFNKTDETGHDVELSIFVETDRDDPSRFSISYSRDIGSLVPTPTP